MPPQFRKALDLATVCLQEYRVSDDAEEKAIMLRYIGLTLWEYSWLVLLFAALMGIFMFLMRKTIIVVSRLIEYDLRDNQINTNIWARQQRHYFLSAGAAIPIKGDALVFKPSILVKNVGLLSSFSKNTAFEDIGAPTEFDIDLSLFFQQALWVGVSFRSAIEGVVGDQSSFDSADIWAAYYLANGLRIGAAYDYTLSKLQDVSGASFELMLGYEFDYKTKQVVTPRYF